MGWILLLVIVVGGFYFYQKLLGIEQEIRWEQAGEVSARTQATARPPSAGDDVVKPDVAPPIFRERVQLEPDPLIEGDSPGPLSRDEALLKVINDLPGLLQTELYELFPGEERKRLQGLLLRLDQQGAVRREKKKGSYRVFPA